MQNERFEWHDRKARTNLRDHGVSFEEATDVFDDDLVAASLGVDARWLRAIEPFPTTGLIPYDPGYLAGWTVERYQIDLTTAAEKARGAPGTVVAAQGMTIAFHAGVSGGPVGLLVEGLASGGNVNVEELEKKFEAEMAAGAPIPLHLLSLFLVAESATAQWAQIALLYADRNSAEIAAPIILERLAAFLPEAQRIASAAIRKVDFADGPIGTTLAVLTLAYPADPPFAARREASLWLQATYNRQFTVLDPTR